MFDPGQPETGIAPSFKSDVDFRRRIQRAPAGFSVAGPESACIYHALSTAAGVMDASAIIQPAGVALSKKRRKIGRVDDRSFFSDAPTQLDLETVHGGAPASCGDAAMGADIGPCS